METTRLLRLPAPPLPAAGADDPVRPARAASCDVLLSSLGARRLQRGVRASWEGFQLAWHRARIAWHHAAAAWRGARPIWYGAWMNRRGSHLALLLAAATLAAGGARAADLDAGPLLELTSFPRSTLTIHSATGPQGQVFRVWLADTPQRQSQGLMYVRDLPADEGMLFFDRQSRIWAMWMKNTVVSRDMLFIDARGRVVAIRERTVPHSLQTLSHPQPVKAVLELKGGETARRGLRVGDRVEHPLFRGRGPPGDAAP